MPKKSTIENKNPYLLCREKAELTRESASEFLSFGTGRIERIESEKALPHPDEVLEMAKLYKKPSLLNYFCSHDCPIGQKHILEVEEKDLSQITLELLVKINDIYKIKDRLAEITVDGRIAAEEKEEFENIQKRLKEMTKAVNALQLWVDSTIAKENGSSKK